MRDLFYESLIQIVFFMPIWLPPLAFWLFARVFGRRQAFIFAGCTALLVAVDALHIYGWYRFYEKKAAAAATFGTLINGWMGIIVIVFCSALVWAVVFAVVRFVTGLTRHRTERPRLLS